MEKEEPKNYRNQEGLDSLFIEISDTFDELLKSVIIRRDIESFAGKDLSKENQALEQIIQRINAKLDTIRQSPTVNINPRHIMDFIDSLMELLSFMDVKGPIKADLRAKLDAMAQLETVSFAHRNQKPDQEIYLISAAGIACEICLFNLLNAALFTLTTYIAKQTSKADQKLIENPRDTLNKNDRVYQFMEKQTGISPQRFFAMVNRVRTAVIAAAITGMSLQVTNDAVIEYRHHDQTQLSPTIGPVKSKNFKYTQDVLRTAISIFRLYILYLLLKRTFDTYHTAKKIDFNRYLRFELDEIEQEQPNPSSLKAMGKLYHQMNLALKHMDRDPNYDPSPIIVKIKEGLEAVLAGQSLHIKNFLKDSKKNVWEELKRRAERDAETKKLLPKSRETASRNIQVIQFELPPIKKALTREERKTLHARQKEEEISSQTKEEVDTVLVPQQKPDPVCSISPVDERESLLKKIHFQRELNGMDFRKFLRAMSFQKEEGGKGSHEKYALKVNGGTLVVILSRNFNHYGDCKIKADLLRKAPYLNPEWVYWIYCRQFACAESIANYAEFFGREYDPKQEPSRI